MTLAQVPEGERDTTARIDWGGLVTFSGGLFCLVLALIRGNNEGWGSPLIVGLLAASAECCGSQLIAGLLAATVVLLVAFVVTELRIESPMLDLKLFRIPAFPGA